MRRTALLLALCLLLMIPLPAAAAGEIDLNHLARAVKISPRGSDYFIDSAGVLQRMRADGDAAAEPVMENVAGVWGADWSTFALDESGTLWSWGNNASGNQGYAGQSATPVKLLESVASLSHGSTTCLAVLQDGSLWYWGELQMRPVPVMAGISAAFAAEHQSGHDMAVDHDGGLWSWTARWDDDWDRYTYTPYKIMDAAATCTGGMVIDTSGTLWRLEAGEDGLIEPVRQMDSIAQVAPYQLEGPAFQPYTLALDTAGTLWAWPAERPDTEPIKAATGCAFLAGSLHDRYAYYLDTRGNLQRLTRSGSAFSTKALDSGVVYVTATADLTVAYVKADGGLYTYCYGYDNEADRPTETIVHQGAVLMSPLGSRRPGVPLSPDYTAAIEPVQGFEDIEGHWAGAAILRWAEYGIVQGSDGLFRPEDALTRAEFAAILGRLLGHTVVSATETFNDVAVDAWYDRDMATANAYGWLMGDGAGHMRPLDSLTYEEAVTVLARVFSLVSASGGYQPFEDVSDWAVPAVVGLLNHLPYRDGERDFSAKAAISRGSLMALLDRLIALYIPQSGYYGDPLEHRHIYGNVVIAANEVCLRSMTISGNVYITPGTGGWNTRLLLREVQVGGTLHIDGEMQGLTLRDCQIEHIHTGRITGISATGATDVQRVTIESQTRMSETDLAAGAGGFRNIHITPRCTDEMPMLLVGDFGRLVNSASGVHIDLRGTVADYSPVAAATLTGEHTIKATHPAQALPPDLQPWTYLGLPRGEAAYGIRGVALLEDTLYAQGAWGVYRLLADGQWERVFEGSTYSFAAHDGLLRFFSMADDGPLYWTFDGRALVQLPGSAGTEGAMTEFRGRLYSGIHDTLYVLEPDGSWSAVPGWPEGHRVGGLYATEDMLYVGAGIYQSPGDYGHKTEVIDGYVLAFDGQGWTALTDPLPDEQISAIGVLDSRVFISTTHNGYVYHRYELVDAALVLRDDGLDMFLATPTFFTHQGVLLAAVLDSGSPQSGLYWYDASAERWMETGLGYQRIHAITGLGGRLYIGTEQGVYSMG